MTRRTQPLWADSSPLCPKLKAIPFNRRYRIHIFCVAQKYSWSQGQTIPFTRPATPRTLPHPLTRKNQAGLCTAQLAQPIWWIHTQHRRKSIATGQKMRIVSLLWGAEGFHPALSHGASWSTRCMNALCGGLRGVLVVPAAMEAHRSPK